MKTIVNSATLLKALEQVKKVMERNGPVPIIENYLITVKGNQMKVTGTDLQITLSVSIPCETNQGPGFEMVLSPESLKYLKKLDLQPVFFEYLPESYSIVISSDDGKAKYSGENPADFPKHELPGSTLFTLPGSAIAELKDLLNYTSEDKIRPAMMGVNVDYREGRFNMTATDGHTMKVVNIPELNQEGKNESVFILPAKACKLLAEFKPESVQVMSDEREKAGFVFGNVELITRTIDERYPDYSMVIPDSSTTQYTFDKKVFVKQVDKAELFANKATKAVVICLNGENVIKAEDLDLSNEYAGNIGGTYTGKPIEIGFNAEFLKRIVSSFPGEQLTLEMREPNRAGVIRSGNALALSMPVMACYR